MPSCTSGGKRCFVPPARRDGDRGSRGRRAPNAEPKVIDAPLQPQGSDLMSRNMAANIRLLTVREYLEPASRPVEERRSATHRKRNGTT